jgi:hypothetical protein
MKLEVRTLLVLFLAHLAAGALLAQADRGGVTGRITDSTGAILPQTSVTLRNEDTDVIQTSVTNDQGIYNFQQLNPGLYSITVERRGFKRVDRVHTVVDVNQVNQQNIALELGTTSEVVEVTTGVQQLQTTSASVGLVVEERSIQELPLIYGNPFSLEVLAPGILPSGVNPNIHTYDSATANVSVNGSVLNSLEYRLDGAPDNRIRLSAYTPSTEFINQYRVETATYDATTGHSAGGFVNVSIKSGTNQLHGSAFVYYQNPTLNANPWSLSPITSKPVWLREGGDVGLPLWRDKAFFFAGYEHSRQASPNVQTLTVPTLAQRGGDFSALYALDPTHKGTSNAYQIYDPATGKSATCPNGKNTCTFRTPFAGNIIPSGRLSSIAAAAFKYYPAPNLPGNSDGTNNFGYAGAEPDYYYAYVLRGDANLTSRQSIFGHYVQSRRLQPGKNAYFLPVSGTTLTYQNKGIAFGYTFILTPATVLDAHLTWTRFVNQNVVPSQDKLNATSIGMPNYLINNLPDAAFSFPRLDLTGYQSLNSDNGVLSHDDVTLGSIQISHLFGAHFIRTGYEYRMYNTNGGITTQSNGRYQTTGSYVTGNSSLAAPTSPGFAAAQLLTGIQNSSALTINSDFAVRSNYMAGWVMDDWKARPNLTINMGLRYEYEGPNSERNQKANTYFDFGATNPVAPAVQAAYAPIAAANPSLPSASSFAVNGGLRFLGEQGLTRKDYRAQTLNLLPRIGLSWQFEPHSVFRAGYGIFYDSLTTFYLSGGNSGSTSTFLLPQQGFTSTTTQNSSADTGLTFAAPLSNPFPSGIAQPTGSTLGLQTFLGQAVSFQPLTPKNPYNQRWSMGFQHSFGAWLAALDYVGNHGVHLPVQKEYDAIPQSLLSTVTNGYDTAANTKFTTTYANPFRNILPNTTSLGSGSTVAYSQLVRPYPQFTSVTAYITNGSSIYHSLQAQLLRRFTNGASFTSAFTWSKSLDATQYLNTSDQRLWYGISANDRTFRLALSGIYQLPFGSGRQFLNRPGIVSLVVGGWQMQGLYQVQSGAPLSFTPSSTSPLYNGANPVASAWGRGGYKKSIPNPSTAGNWFNTSNWATTTSTTQTSGVVTGVTPNQYQIRTFPIRFDSLRADFLNQWDAGIQRNFALSRIYEPLQLQFRAEGFNLLNHPVYSAPSTDWTNKAFGQITSQGNQPRVWQFVAIVRF